MSNLTKRLDRLENVIGEQITIIIRSYLGTEHFDFSKNPEKFKRIKAGWPSNYTVLKELSGEQDE